MFQGRLGLSSQSNRYLLFYDLKKSKGYCYKYVIKKETNHYKTVLCLGCKIANDQCRRKGLPNHSVHSIKAHGDKFFVDPEKEQHYCKPYSRAKLEAENLLRSSRRNFMTNLSKKKPISTKDKSGREISLISQEISSESDKNDDICDKTHSFNENNISKSFIENNGYETIIDVYAVKKENLITTKPLPQRINIVYVDKKVKYITY